MTDSPPPPISFKRRIFLALLVLIAVLIVVGLVQRWRTGVRAVSELQAIMDDLDANDPHWRLDQLEAARAEVPTDENSARLLVHIARLYPPGWPPYTDISPPEGTPANVRLDPATEVRLRKEMVAMAALTAEARKLAAMPRGRHVINLNLDNPFLTILEDQQNTRRSAELMYFDAVDRAHAGEIDGALQSCQAGMNAAASLRDEPLLISQLIRTGCFLRATDGVERALALGVASDKALASVQQHIETELVSSGMLNSLRGERAAVHATLTSLSRGKVRLSDLPDFSSMPPDLQIRHNIAPFTIAQLARDEHPTMLRLATRAVEIGKLPMYEQPAAEAIFNADVRKMAERVRLIQPLLPALTNYNANERRKAALARSLLTAVAAERFRLKTKRWPERLEELTPDLLKTVPFDPFDGKPVRYKRLADGVMVYSIGQDATDDGGNIDRVRPLLRGTDIGYRLWDVEKRSEAAKPGVPGNDG